MIVSRISKPFLVALAFGLVMAACGGDDEADGTATTVAEETATDETPAEEPTGEEEPASEALVRVRTKAEAAEAVLPDDHTSSIQEGDTEGPEEDDLVFAPCQDEGDFDLNSVRSVTAAVATLSSEGPVQPSGFPGVSASVEVRVFDSAEESEAALRAVGEILGTVDGRDCLADTVAESLVGQADDAEVDFSIDELSVPGVDSAARVTMAISAEDIEASIAIDLLVTGDGDVSVYGSFLGFDEEFPSDLQSELMTAARDG